MTMEWSSGLSLSWHKEKCSQVRLDVCYMEEAYKNRVESAIFYGNRIISESGDSRLGYYHDRPAWDYMCMTELYAGQGEKENALASMEKAIEHIRRYKESCQREVFTESVFWYDKRVSKGAKGVWKEEKMDLGFVKQMEKLIQGSLGELLSPEEAAEVRSRVETVCVLSELNLS